MKVVLLFLGGLLCHHTYSQFRGANWCFGDSIGFKFIGDTILQYTSAISTFEPCATISDENGNLLFYTNGAKVWNKNHTIMTLGDHLLLGGGWPLSTTTQGVIIIPDPGKTNEYYIFQNDSPNYYYSKVDMSLSDGLGSVYIRNELLWDIPAMEKMTAVKHGNGRDWWLIIPAYPEGGSDGYGNPYLYYEFLITPSGIDGPFIMEGVIYENQNTLISMGQLKFNQQGNIFADPNGKLIILYKFDRCSGEFYQLYTIDSIFSGGYYDLFYGIEFSQNGDLLYATKVSTNSTNKLYQFSLYNLPESDPIITLLANSSISDSSKLQFSQLMIAQDNKIYITSPDLVAYNSFNLTNFYLSIIKNPNESGLLCGTEILSTYNGGHKYLYALPNMPNYNLGPLEQSECDTLSTSINSINYNSSFTIAPNPVQEMFYIKTKQNIGSVFTLCIINTQGAEAMYLPQYIPGSTVSVSHLPEGMYAVLLMDEKGFSHQQKLIISR